MFLLAVVVALLAVQVAQGPFRLVTSNSTKAGVHMVPWRFARHTLPTAVELYVAQS